MPSAHFEGKQQPQPMSIQQRVAECLARPTMILCVCHRIPAKRIVRLVEDGRARTMADVMAQCGAGSACNCCEEQIDALITALRERSEGRG